MSAVSLPQYLASKIRSAGTALHDAVAKMPDDRIGWHLDLGRPMIGRRRSLYLPLVNRLSHDDAQTTNSVDLQGGVGGVARENLARDARLAVHSISVHSL